MRHTLIIALLACAVPLSAVSQDHRTVAEFLGWRADSTEFAFKRLRYKPGKTTRETWFLKRTSRSGVAQPMRGTDVRDRLHKGGFTIKELEVQRLSQYVQAFMVGAGKTLRVELQVGKRRLSYALWLDDARRPLTPKRLLRGYFKELWTSLEARAFPSPNGEWVALVLTMHSPYDQKSWIEGVALVDKPR